MPALKTSPPSADHVLPNTAFARSLDLFASFGILSAGDVDAEKVIAKFLNDPDKPTPEVRQLVKDNQWAKYRVVCQGDHIQTWVNGVKVTDLHDGMTKSGFIGLQVHSVGARQDPLQVRWRDVRLRELSS